MSNNRLPVPVVDKLPDGFDEANVRRTNQIEGLIEGCETILHYDGKQTQSAVYDRMTVAATPLPIEVGTARLYGRLYRGSSKNKNPSYGLLLSASRHAAKSYDDYAVIRIEKGLAGFYEVVVGGAEKEPELNNPEVLEYLDTTVNRLAANLSAAHEKAMLRRLQLAKRLGTIGMAAAVAGVASIHFMGGSEPGLKHNLMVVRMGQHGSPNYIKNWRQQAEHNDYIQIQFEADGTLGRHCKKQPIASQHITGAVGVTDYHENDIATGDESHGDADQFDIVVNPTDITVCWNPEEAGTFNDYSTVHPIVGLKLVLAKR